MDRVLCFDFCGGGGGGGGDDNLVRCAACKLELELQSPGSEKFKSWLSESNKALHCGGARGDLALEYGAVELTSTDELTSPGIGNFEHSQSVSACCLRVDLKREFIVELEGDRLPFRGDEKKSLIEATSASLVGDTGADLGLLSVNFSPGSGRCKKSLSEAIVAWPSGTATNLRISSVDVFPEMGTGKFSLSEVISAWRGGTVADLKLFCVEVSPGSGCSIRSLSEAKKKFRGNKALADFEVYPKPAP